jgi:hypothetical protein
VCTVLLPVLGMPTIGVAQDPRLSARLDPPTARVVDSLVQSAARVGLPAEPLVQLALEGQSKGATSQRIIAAVEGLGAGMARSRDLLGASSSNGELVAGAMWLRSGGAPADLSQFRTAGSGRSLALPLSVGADLLKLGWPSGEAGSAMRSLLEARVPDADLVAFSNRLDRLGKPSARTADALRQEVARMTAGPALRP